MDAEPLGTPKSNVLGSPENYDTFNSAVKLEPAVDVLEYMTVGKPYWKILEKTEKDGAWFADVTDKNVDGESVRIKVPLAKEAF